MYASLIGAGVSQLYDLLRSQTQPSESSTSSPGTAPTSTSAPATATTTGTGQVGALSSDLNKLLLDLRSGGTTSATSDAGSATHAAHGHHHHRSGADAQSASNPLLAYAKGQGLTASQGASTSLTV